MRESRRERERVRQAVLGLSLRDSVQVPRPSSHLRQFAAVSREESRARTAPRSIRLAHRLSHMTSHSRRANWLTVYILSSLGFATSRPTCAKSANPNVSDATPPNAQLREPQAQRNTCALSRISA